MTIAIVAAAGSQVLAAGGFPNHHHHHLEHPLDQPDEQGQLRVAGSEVHEMLRLRGKLFQATPLILPGKVAIFHPFKMAHFIMH